MAKNDEKYTDPQLRTEIKEKIQDGDKGGNPGQWSARKAQMMASEYKKEMHNRNEEPYTTDKSDKTSSQKHLSNWTEEEWQTQDGSANAKKEDGEMKRYLPKKAWEGMSEEEKKETEKKKEAGGKDGKQFVQNTDKAKDARKSASKSKPESKKSSPKSKAAPKQNNKKRDADKMDVDDGNADEKAQDEDKTAKKAEESSKRTVDDSSMAVDSSENYGKDSTGLGDDDAEFQGGAVEEVVDEEAAGPVNPSKPNTNEDADGADTTDSEADSPNEIADLNKEAEALITDAKTLNPADGEVDEDKKRAAKKMRTDKKGGGRITRSMIDDEGKKRKVVKDEVAGATDADFGDDEVEEGAEHEQKKDQKEEKAEASGEDSQGSEKENKVKGRKAPAAKKFSPNSKKPESTKSKKPESKSKKDEGKGDEEHGEPASASRLPKDGQEVFWRATPGWVKGTVVEIVRSNKEVGGISAKASKDDPRIALKSSSSGKVAVHKPQAVYF